MNSAQVLQYALTKGLGKREQRLLFHFLLLISFQQRSASNIKYTVIVNMGQAYEAKPYNIKQLLTR